jgi:hypothetical protein
MQQIRVLLATVVCAIFLLAGASAVSAQVLHGSWFELRVSAKGYTVGLDESVSKTKLKATAYLYVVWNGSGYNWVQFRETAAGMWSSIQSGSFVLVRSEEDYVFMLDDFWVARTPDGADIPFHFTGVFRTKVDKTGALRSARFETLSAQFFEGEATDGAAIYGGVTVKGKLCAQPFPV